MPLTRKEGSQSVNWRSRLSMKSPSCQRGYKKHILNFIEVMGKVEYFCQDDIDDYLIRVHNQDM